MRRTCFFVAPIGSPGTLVRQRSDRILDLLVRPALLGLGYEVLRLDRLGYAGSLSAQARTLARHADLVVADLTGGNANVFYELGWRHAADKPCIHLIEHGEQIAFDVADLRACFVDTTSEATVRATIPEFTKHALTALSRNRGPAHCPSEEEFAAFLEQPLTAMELQYVTAAATAPTVAEKVAVAEGPDELRGPDNGSHHDDGDNIPAREKAKFSPASIRSAKLWRCLPLAA